MAVRLNESRKENCKGKLSKRTCCLKYLRFSVLLISIASLLISCAPIQPTFVSPPVTVEPTQTPLPEIIRTPIPARPVYAPATLVDYTALPGDSIAVLAQHFNTTAAEILEANPLINKNTTTLAAGLQMKIPIYYKALWGSQFHIMPDALFVNGPAGIGFNTSEFVDSQPGWLKNYTVLAGGVGRRGGDLIDFVALTYSVSPRVLLALAEYQAGALSQPLLNPDIETYPLGYANQFDHGFYLQLLWAANLLNNGFYSWRNGRLESFSTTDGNIVVPDPWQNAATIAFQYYYAQLFNGKEYDRAIRDDGIYATYMNYFGNPWQNPQSYIPGNLQQPDMVLPFVAGKRWDFTGGPHGGWGTGEPLAAIDFGPPVTGCSPTVDYVVAMADGQIVRSGSAIAILDLDQDGDERTGWVILYLHLGGNEVISPGVLVKTGDFIGHPSCEGGEATGTHIHIARKYNGEWVDADSAIPFNLEGWIVHNGSAPYKGTLQRYGRFVTASDKGLTESSITAGVK